MYRLRFIVEPSEERLPMYLLCVLRQNDVHIRLTPPKNTREMQKLNETFKKLKFDWNFTNHRGITWDSIAPARTKSLKH